MRALKDYGSSDWLKATPLVHAFKRGRNIVVDRAFRALRPAGFDRFLAGIGEPGSGTLVITIAYNTPWAVDLLLRTNTRHLSGTLVVCDNSRSREARRAIQTLCRDAGVHYLGLPPNPESHPCRSHGIALNWVYANLVTALRPKLVALVDHDLFAAAPVNLADRLGTQPVFGLLKTSPWGWYVWPGYSIFDFASIAGTAPDFNTDIPRLLDTGGQNWRRFYASLDRDGLRFAELNYADLQHGSRTTRVQMIDGLLHFGGASFGGYGQARDNRDLFIHIVDRLAAGEPISAMAPQAA